MILPSKGLRDLDRFAGRLVWRSRFWVWLLQTSVNAEFTLAAVAPIMGSNPDVTAGRRVTQVVLTAANAALRLEEPPIGYGHNRFSSAHCGLITLKLRPKNITQPSRNSHTPFIYTTRGLGPVTGCL